MYVDLKPISTIKAQLGLNPNGKVLRKFQDSCYRHMDKYVPYREGNLSGRVDLSNPKYIIYEMPYAHYMYEGKMMVDAETGSSWARKGTRKVYNGKDLHYNTPAGHEYAGPYWDRRMVSAEIDEVIKEVQESIGGR